MGWRYYLVLALCWCVGCGPSLSRDFLDTKAAGHRAYGSGRYTEAAQYFHQAAQKVDHTKQRDELLYLEAMAYQRAGNYPKTEQCLQDLLTLSPDGDRAATVAHELVRMKFRSGNKTEAGKMLHEFILKYPDSGLVRPAAIKYWEYLDSVHGAQSTLEYLEKNYEWYDDNGLGEMNAFHQARRLEMLGQLQAARDRYVACANAYPYPNSTLFDDALYAASLLDEKLGNPKQAIEDLRKMLSYKEKSALLGTYQRRQYDKAQMRIAELYRDVLGDLTQARKEYRRFYKEFPNSRLRDDALWQEALLAKRQRDDEGACEPVKLLVKEFPLSRYAPCAKLLCKDAPAAKTQEQKKGKQSEPECRDYIKRDVAKQLSTSE